MAKATKTVKAAPKNAPAKKAAGPVKKAAAPKNAAPVKAPAKKAAAPKTVKTYDDASALRELFIDEIKDIYWAEKALVKALPKMQKAATSSMLKEAIEKHLAETQTQVTRLEEVFGLLGQKAQAKKCDAMDGLLKEGNSIITETEKGSATRDVGIILACQKVEHYEIATYGVLAQLAKTMDLADVKNILGQILDEEKAADETLTQIAENDINMEAMNED